MEGWTTFEDAFCPSCHSSSGHARSCEGEECPKKGTDHFHCAMCEKGILIIDKPASAASVTQIH